MTTVIWSMDPPQVFLDQTLLTILILLFPKLRDLEDEKTGSNSPTHGSGIMTFA